MPIETDRALVYRRIKYHSGFRSQAASWPSQPIQLFISSLTFGSYSASSGAKPTIADLGCGDGQLAQTLVPRGFTVFSYDLVEKLPWINEAQCTQRVPLPGTAGSDGNGDAGAVVDVVVCCLSLMGNDWFGMITESRRILRTGCVLVSTYPYVV